MPRKLHPVKAAPEGGNLPSVRLGPVTVRQDFTYKKLESLRLTGANFKQSLFIGAILHGCQFDSVIFDRCDFSGTKLVDCTFINCRFVPDEIRSCLISDCNFHRCDFRGVEWHAVETRRTKLTECDFRQASIRESSFSSCHLNSCRFKRASVTMSSFSHSVFSGIDLGDCTALFLFFTACAFDSSRINAETIGFTYGLSMQNLHALGLIYLGKSQPKPDSSDLVQALIKNYQIRRWHVGTCILQINFRRRMTVLCLRSLADTISETIDRGIPIDWDEMRFLAQVLEWLHAEERLPLAGLWAIANALNRVPAPPDSLLAITASKDLTLRALDRLVLRILDELARLPTVDHADRSLWLELSLIEKPDRPLNELVPLPVYRAFDAGEITLIRSGCGSWFEIWQLSLSALVAIQISLVVVNGVMRQLIKLTDEAEQLARKLPIRGSGRTDVSRQIASMPAQSTQLAATYARTSLPEVAALARIDMVLQALSALSDDDLERLSAYAADRIETAKIRRAPRRRVSRIDPKHAPVG
jgi:Pentapeptide repeats (9 copies)